MTKRLYYDDPYVTSFEGEILRRLETSDGPAVVLKETYFYPESGGQPHDLGTMDGIEIARVIEDGEEVLHVLACFPNSDVVKCRIDEARRRDHTQQHNGQHILSATFLRQSGAQTISFHLGSSTSTIDLDRKNVPPELLSAVEDEANRVVRQNLPVRSYFVESGQAAKLELRKDPTVEGTLRIVEIEEFDRQACCGTHPRNTAEVGIISIRSVERFKGNTRVEFVCGDRAMRDYKTAIERIRSLAQVLNSPESGLVNTASRLVDEKKELTKSLQAFREQALQSQAAEWVSNAESREGLKLVVRVVPDVTPAELRRTAVYVTTGPARVALLGALAEARAHLVFGKSPDVEGPDMSAILRQVVPIVEGRGGGSPEIAQGGGPRLDGLEKALETASRIVIKGCK